MTLDRTLNRILLIPDGNLVILDKSLMISVRILMIFVIWDRILNWILLICHRQVRGGDGRGGTRDTPGRLRSGKGALAGAPYEVLRTTF